MLKYNRKNVSEGIDTNKRDGLHDCIIVITGTFSNVCNGCHDVTQKSMSFDNFAIAIIAKTIIELTFCL